MCKINNPSTHITEIRGQDLVLQKQVYQINDRRISPVQILREENISLFLFLIIQ